MRYVFIINPTAGKRVKQEPIKNAIEKYFAENGGDYKIHITRFAGDAKEVAKAQAQSGDDVALFACGGEGTVFEVVNGVVGYDNVSVGVIPCGSANDFLKFFENSEPFSDISAQVNGDKVKMDLIKANDDYCLNGCSVGMDAMVARDMSIFKDLPLVSGSLAYKLAIVKNFFGKIGVKINLSVDNGASQAVSCLFAVIANAPFYGGGYNAAPQAVPADGMLDFTRVDLISRLKVPKFLSLYQNGNHGGLDYCTLKRCSCMDFTADRPIPINLDGEIVEKTSMHFEIVKKALSFIIPQGVKSKILTKIK